MEWMQQYTVLRYIYQNLSICTKFQIYENIFIIRQAHLRLHVQKQGNFCRSLHKQRPDIELCANFLAAVTKQQKVKSQFFAVRFLRRSSSKHNSIVSLKKRTVFELLHLQNLYFYFSPNLPKMLLDIKKTKGQI